MAKIILCFFTGLYDCLNISRKERNTNAVIVVESCQWRFTAVMAYHATTKLGEVFAVNSTLPQLGTTTLSKFFPVMFGTKE